MEISIHFLDSKNPTRFFAGALLLDEPFSGLDAENTSTMTEIINSLNPEILIITQHEKLQNSELNYNRIIKIANGCIEREI